MSLINWKHWIWSLNLYPKRALLMSFILILIWFCIGFWYGYVSETDSETKELRYLREFEIDSVFFEWAPPKSWFRGCSTSWSDVTSRVPRGSILGPLIFVIFINDLPEVIEGYCKIYADDSKIIRAIEDESSAESLQRDIDSLSNWTREWLMKLNSSKCFLVIKMLDLITLLTI